MSVRRYPAVTFPPPAHLSTFDANVTGWGAFQAGGTLTRDTIADAGRPSVAAGSLRFQSTSAANFGVSSPFVAVSPSRDYTVMFRIRIGAATQRFIMGTVDEFDSGTGYVSGFYDAAGRMVQAGTDWWHYSFSARSSASTAFLQLSISVQTAAAAAEQAWVDNVLVVT